MTDKSLQALVEDLPEIYQPIYQHTELSEKVSRYSMDRLETISKVHDSLQKELGRPVRVLDLGCAQGFISLNLAERGAVVHGIDYLEQNVLVCKALASEFSHFQVTFDLTLVEQIMADLKPDQYDMVLGLSIFHHLIHEHGIPKIRAWIDLIAEHVKVFVSEMALGTEPPYWAPSQPKDPRELLDGFAFVHELKEHETHLSAVKRPLFFASNQYWCLGNLFGSFDSWRTESHALSNWTHQGSRRYFFNDDYFIKTLRFDHHRGELNRTELLRESSFLQSPLPNFNTPSIIQSGSNEKEGWIVLTRIHGQLLLEKILKKETLNPKQLLESILDQVIALETTGLYHNDLRSWNILLSEDNKVYIIDHGAISTTAQDCCWPFNLSLSFFILVKEITSGVIDSPAPFRSINISPGLLPQPYRTWALKLWKHPSDKWCFQLMRDLLQKTLKNKDQHEEPNTPQEAWNTEIENLLQALVHEVMPQAKSEMNEVSLRVNQAQSRANEAQSRANETQSRANEAMARIESIEAQLKSSGLRGLKRKLHQFFCKKR